MVQIFKDERDIDDECCKKDDDDKDSGGVESLACAARNQHSLELANCGEALYPARTARPTRQSSRHPHDPLDWQSHC